MIGALLVIRYLQKEVFSSVVCFNLCVHSAHSYQIITGTNVMSHQSLLMCIRIAIAVVDTAVEPMPHLQFTNSTNYNGH